MFQVSFLPKLLDLSRLKSSFASFCIFEKSKDFSKIGQK
jgi:hypothetical protein